jgi:putative transposase
MDGSLSECKYIGLNFSFPCSFPRFFETSECFVLWRSAVLKLLRTALRSGVLATEMGDHEMEAMLVAQERWWSVNIKSLDSIEHFFQYSGRYARRPVIAQRRITYIGEQTVQFWAKDKRSGEMVQLCRTLEEFIDLWSQHILKRYKHAVRYFGLFAPRALNKTLELIFAATGHKRQPRPTPLRWADSRKMSGQYPLVDRTGQRMNWVRRLAPQPSH